MKYIAYTTKGLEFIAEEEIKSKLNAKIQEVADKRIIFDSNASYEQLVQLTTVDDIGLLIAHKENITSAQNILEILVGKFTPEYKTF
jgi:23S rRNA G2445 N2-methylase RlmL